MNKLFEKLKLFWVNIRFHHVAIAIRIHKNAMKKDPSFANAWHANIAMPIYDNMMKERKSDMAQLKIEFANECADILMKHLFEIDANKMRASLEGRAKELKDDEEFRTPLLARKTK